MTSRILHFVLAALLLLVFQTSVAAPKPSVVAPAAPVSPTPATTTPATTPTTTPATTPTLEQAQARLAALAAIRDLPEAERTQAQDLYQRVISQVQAAKNYADSAAAYQQLQQSAPAETARLQQILTSEPLPAPSPALSPDDLAKQLAKSQAGLSDAEKSLADLDQQLATQQARPKSIPTELDTLKQQVADLDAKLQATVAPTTTPLLADARLMALTAQRQALNQQIATLEQERLSYDARLPLLNAQRAVAAQEVAQAQTRVQQLQSLLNTRRRDEAAAVVQQTTQAQEEAAAKPAVVQNIAAENAEISRHLEEIVRQSDQMSASQTQFSEQLTLLTERMRGIQQQLGIAGFSDAIGPILLEERRNLPDVRQYQRNADDRQDAIVQARLEQYKTEKELRRARAVEEHLKELVVRFDPQWSEAQRQTVSAELRSLLTDRQQLLKKLSSGYANLITGLVALDDSQRKLGDQAEQYGALLDRYLLWIRSSPPINAAWLHDFGLALDWLADPTHWRAAGQNLLRGAQSRPAATAFGVLALLGLLYYRRALIRRLGDSVDALGDVRADRFWLTTRALGITLLLAAPWPGLLLGLAGLLRSAAMDAEFSRGLSQGLVSGAFLTANITFLRQSCRPQGLAIVHFGWSEAGCQLLRRHLNWFLWIGPLSVIISRLCEVQTDTLYSDTLGRLIFSISQLALTVLLWQVLDPRHSLLSGLAEERSPGVAWRLRYLWYPLFIGGHLLMAPLALSGYYYTALQLRSRLALTGWLIMGAVLLVNLALRWLNLSHRRLALQHALVKREAQLAARAKEAPPASGEGLPEVLNLPELELNLDTISEQTRSLMRLTVLVGLGFGFWQIWGGLVPAFAILNDITLWHQTVQTAAGAQITDITLGSTVVAGALLFLIVFLARNLPGVLELVVLQRLAVDSGNRNAIITISRYLITGAGLLIALDIVGIGWDQVQWLVAALGVGLGFGLKEIFSNFFSGLILLLERPIRVGDTVTLGTLSGTVSRINIRATTITDWDRKEIIVPNNTFITSSLINWARNDPVTRVVIPIGVAYDCDPQQVHQVLLDTVVAHPLAMKDPAPAVLFINFGESALEFEIRVFVRELANRLPLTHDLHNRIFAALREHQIEIPFPQREVRIKQGTLGEKSL
jgi:potassium efflux system protein